GGLFKAIKSVSGALGLARQELESLQRVKAIRHPFILSLERVELDGDLLLIVMELADKSLHDLFLECRKLGMTGLPRKELLGLLREGGGALEWMPSPQGAQPRAAKPQTLFLVSTPLKGAAFGRVGSLRERGCDTPRPPAGATPLYAPPELLRGVVSRH